MTREEAIKTLSERYSSALFSERTALETLIPELKESEGEIHEWILEYLYDGLRKSDEQFKGQFKSAIDWLENLGNMDIETYKNAEKEKSDFVGDGFIKCYANYLDFKEGETYWLEYVGKDNYNVRSDNLLGKTYHITPYQLYRLFTKEHCPKEDSVNEGTNAPTGYGKYVDECLNEASKHFFSDGEDKYSVADLFHAGVRCGKSWLEKQGEQEPLEWSEEDEDMYARIVRRYTDYEGVIMRTKEESVAAKILNAMTQEEIWLKSLRPQTKVKWSEEDEHRCGDAIYFLETAKKHYADTSEIELTIEWLKSLRSQPKVEWSEEE